MEKRIRLSASSADSWETDWTKCCLCQEVTTDLLKSSDEGYTMLGKNIPLFHELNSLPIPLDIRRSNHGEGIESTIKKENAKCTPRSKDQQPDQVDHKCFICDKESPLSVLRVAMTMKLNQRLVDCATVLQDKQLLAKLSSSGDVIAQEMKYHPS
ncbi:unnamed protein product [Mytilus coruscus]|uniref:Uncharacterized protein n=1 Tax=Mytilus coruscus TaxID=42192 RepID=A0A6J8DIJ4_MYTCO|nr:unnamed protein product [Mytilus coruscus]